MTEKIDSFQKKVNAEIKLTKKHIYKEEIWSFICACVSSGNLCCIFMLPFSIATPFHLWFVYQGITYFKPTIKTQYYLHQHLKSLIATKNEKIWTLNNK